MERNKKSLNLTFLKALEKVIRAEVEKDTVGGTSYCSGIFHQPVRPQKH